jgi:hypothetical protein
MTVPTDQDPRECAETGTSRPTLSRRALLGIIVALWSTGSLSNGRTARLLYGLQGYAQFGYGGAAPDRYEK